MVKNPLALPLYETIDLAPYVTSAISIAGSCYAKRISPTAVLISFNGITSTGQANDEVIFQNLPFSVNVLTIGWLFANPAMSGEFNNSVRCLVYGSGNNILATHPVMSNLYYGQLILSINEVAV